MARITFLFILISLPTVLDVNKPVAWKNVTTNYIRPLSFEPNRGQTDRQVDFLAHGAGYNLFLSHGQAVMAFKDGPPVRMSPVGANLSAPEAIDPQASKSNYFVGNKPEKWHTNVANYTKVRYRDVYPGVDLIYYGNQRQLEYDFVIAPGANAADILLDFNGSANPKLERSGELVMNTVGGELRWHKPVAYQEVGGKRQLVACSYKPKGGRLAFSVGIYDRTKALVIDPVLAYSTYLGGSGSINCCVGDYGNGIAVDRFGNAYVTGGTFSYDFPTTRGAFQQLYPGYFFNTETAFVTKFNATGKLVYSTYLGGSSGSGDVAMGIAVDADGNAYITGETSSTDFPVKNAFQAHPSAAGNSFVTKLDASGSSLVYSTYLGGSAASQESPQAESFGIAVDRSGSAYVTGFTDEVDFPIKNAFQRVLKGQDSVNAFVTKFDPSGSELAYSTYLGGSGLGRNTFALGIAVDNGSYAYVTGVTQSTDFPVKNAFQNQLNSPNGNAFVTKFDTTGRTLVYSTFLGGSSNANSGDGGSGIAVNSSGEAFVTGSATSSDFPIKNAFQSILKGSSNAFVTKFDAAGNALVYSTYLGGSASDYGQGIAADRQGNAYITGVTTSPDFPTEKPLESQLESADGNAFVTVFDAAGTTLVYSTYLGGPGSNPFSLPTDSGKGIAVDSRGNAYIVGSTRSTKFPIKNAFQLKLKTPYGNAFVTKIASQ